MLLKGITCFSVCSSTIHTKNKRKMLVSGKTAVYVALSVSRLYICSFKNPLRTIVVLLVFSVLFFFLFFGCIFVYVWCSFFFFLRLPFNLVALSALLGFAWHLAELL